MAKKVTLVVAAFAALAVACTFGTETDSVASAAQLREKKTLSLSAAKKMAAVVEAEAAKAGAAVTIVVVDDGGKLIYLERMDGAMSGPMEVTEGKARTAAGFGEPSKNFKDRMAQGGPDAGLATFPITAAAGGLPVIIDGQTVGAVAVGGAKDAFDEQVAEDAVAAITK
jgi:glc operon protein GlcG